MAEITGAVLMTAFGTYYFLKKPTDRKRALFFKALATAVPGALMLLHLPGGASGVDSLAFAGTLAAIVLYMAADVLLECRFIWGAASFAAGHICMAAGFLFSGETVLLRLGEGGYRPDGELLLLTGAVYAGSILAACLALRTYFPALRKKKLFYPLIAYILVLGVMVSLAVTAGVRSGDVSGMIPAAGGICFAVSDILLGRNRMGRRRSRACGALVLILYYMAVYLFALRLWI